MVSLNITSQKTADFYFFSDMPDIGIVGNLTATCDGVEYVLEQDGGALILKFAAQSDCMTAMIRNFNERLPSSRRFADPPFSMIYSLSSGHIQVSEFGKSMTLQKPTGMKTPFSVAPFPGSSPVYEYVSTDPVSGIEYYAAQMAVTSEQTADFQVYVTTASPLANMTLNMDCKSLAARFNAELQTLEIGLDSDQSECFRDFVNLLHSKLPDNPTWTRGSIPQKLYWDPYALSLNGNLVVPFQMVLLQ